MATELPTPDFSLLSEMQITKRSLAEAYLVVGLDKAYRPFLLDGFKLLYQMVLYKQNPNLKTPELLVAAQTYLKDNPMTVQQAFAILDKSWRDTTGFYSAPSPVQKAMQRNSLK
jgi:hypothetical protein